MKQKMASNKNIGIVKPLMTRKCARCGKWFAACHPKDTQTLCERCRVGKQIKKTAIPVKGRAREGI